MKREQQLVVDALRTNPESDLMLLCEKTGLYAADVVRALDELIAWGRAEQVGQFYSLATLTGSIDQAIDAHLARLNEKRE